MSHTGHWYTVVTRGERVGRGGGEIAGAGWRCRQASGRALANQCPELEWQSASPAWPVASRTRLGSFVAVGGEFWWPSVGRSVAAYGEFLMAADMQSIRDSKVDDLHLVEVTR